MVTGDPRLFPRTRARLFRFRQDRRSLADITETTS